MNPKRPLVSPSKISLSKISLSKRANQIATSILPAIFLAFVSCVAAFSQNPPKDLSANNLLRKAVDSELKGQSNDHSHWMYQVTANDPGKKQVK